MDKVILVGGGTGGHCIPMLSLYKRFIELNINCQIITDKRGAFFFKELDQDNIFIIKTVTNLISKTEQLINFPIIFFQMIAHAINSKSIHIIGFGGYLTLPVLLSAKLANKKISIHEGNAVMGTANRALSKYASNIFLTFDETKKINKNFYSKTHTVGLPLRDEFRDLVIKNHKKFIITVLGGSQGSSSLADKVSTGIIKFSKKINLELLVYHQCRIEDVELLKNNYHDSNIQNEVSSYFNDMPKKIFESNVVISRSGSSTVNEIIYANKPSILIPFPFAIDNHQFHNANILKQISCTKIIKNSDLSSDLILNDLLGFYNNPDKVDRIKKKLSEITQENTAERILDLIRN